MDISHIRDNQDAAKDVDLRIKVRTECIDSHRGHRDGCAHQKREYKRRKRETQRFETTGNDLYLGLRSMNKNTDIDSKEHIFIYGQRKECYKNRKK